MCGKLSFEICTGCKVLVTAGRRAGTLNPHEQLRYRVDAGGDSPGPAHDSRARFLLWRPCPLEERAEHDDDERLGPRLRRDRVGAGGLLDRFRTGVGVGGRLLTRSTLRSGA